MTIAELITKAINKPGVFVQMLQECVSNVHAGKKHTSVTFVTEHAQPADFLPRAQSEKVGLIIWIPRDLYERLSR